MSTLIDWDKPLQTTLGGYPVKAVSVCYDAEGRRISVLIVNCPNGPYPTWKFMNNPDGIENVPETREFYVRIESTRHNRIYNDDFDLGGFKVCGFYRSEEIARKYNRREGDKLIKVKEVRE